MGIRGTLKDNALTKGSSVEAAFLCERNGPPRWSAPWRNVKAGKRRGAHKSCVAYLKTALLELCRALREARGFPAGRRML